MHWLQKNTKPSGCGMPFDKGGESSAAKNIRLYRLRVCEFEDNRLCLWLY